MNVFDILVAANAIVAVIALYQVHLCTLILCANSLLVARALGSIQRSGAPISQAFLPNYVFSQDNLNIAAGILAISLFTVVGFSVLFSRRRVRIGPDAPPVPKLLLLLIALYLVAYFGSTATILSAGYMEQGSARYDLELAGAHALICSLLIYEVVRRRLLAELTAFRAFALIFCSLGLVHYLRGATGITTGYLVTAAVLLIPRTGSAQRIRNVFRVIAVISAIVVMSFIVRGVRVVLYAEGSTAVSTVVDNILSLEETRDETAEGAEAVANATQSAALMLVCITLYNTGASREWRSMYNVIEYTFVPSVFVPWFGWTRSLDAPAEIRDNGFDHGGGINVLGEFYWNGGWPCVVIMTSLLSLFCFFLDSRYRASPTWLMLLVQFGPSFLMGYGYGIAQVARGAVNGLLVVGAYWLWTLARGRNRLPLPPVPIASFH